MSEIQNLGMLMLGAGATALLLCLAVAVMSLLGYIASGEN